MSLGKGSQGRAAGQPLFSSDQHMAVKSFVQKGEEGDGPRKMSHLPIATSPHHSLIFGLVGHLSEVMPPPPQKILFFILY